MKKIIPKLIFILITIALIYFLKTNFAEYNISKSISACIAAQKKTYKSFNLEESKKYCEKKLTLNSFDIINLNLSQFFLNSALFDI